MPRAAAARGMGLAGHAEALSRREPVTWQIVTPAQIGIATFALRLCMIDPLITEADLAETIRRLAEPTP